MNIEFQDLKGYNERIKKGFIQMLIIILVLFAVLVMIIPTSYSIIIAFFILIVQYFKLVDSDKYFIQKLIVSNSRIEIVYKEKNQDKRIEGNINDFIFKIKSTISRSAVHYLSVSYKGENIIKQFESEEWTLMKFKEVVKEIHNK